MAIDTILARTVEEGDCLIWQGRISNGSPVVYYDGAYRTVRRAVWEDAHGPIKPGLHPSCRCREPACVRLEHIRLLTIQQIAKLAAREGKFSSLHRRASLAAAARKRSLLTPEQVARIRAADSAASIARELGISKSTAGKIRRGESWRPIGASVFGF